MLYLLQRLKPNERRGSKARCHLLTHGSVDAVAERLTDLIAPWGKVTTDDRWMPRGFVHTEEAQFGRVVQVCQGLRMVRRGQSQAESPGRRAERVGERHGRTIAPPGGPRAPRDLPCAPMASHNAAARTGRGICQGESWQTTRTASRSRPG